MDKLKLHTPDFTKENIQQLAALFPNCVVESKDAKGKLKRSIDFDQLRQELSDHLVEGPQERYHLNWPGKREALLTANAPIAKTLRPCREESVDFDTTQNLFIEGDNLDALKLLQETYLGKVKMIYIDPPYNTGKEFIYDDDFAETTAEFLTRSNQKDAEGSRLVANTESNGRFHSDWLSMMYARLKLARNLLKDDGVIFISIDDGEVSNLRKVGDEVFGENNFICTIIWQKVYAPKNSARHFSEDHDFILVWAKNSEIWVPNLLERTDEQNSLYKNPDNDVRGPWMSDNLTARNYYAEGSYTITGPTGKEFQPGRGRYWRSSLKKFNELNADNRIWWGVNNDGMPRLKRFLNEVSGGRVPQTLWTYSEVGHTQDAKRELNKYVSFQETENVLNSVKPIGLIKRILHLSTNPQGEDIVLDFFSGSAPTPHAVIDMNKNDGGNRKFIAVQVAEKLPKPEQDLKTIFDLGLNRVANVGKEIEENLPFEFEKLDTGFRVLKVDSSNVKDIYYAPDKINQTELDLFTDHIKGDRSAEDLLFQCMLDWGVELSLPITQETLAGKSVLFVDANAIAACFDADIDEAFVKVLAERKPLRAVFRDSGFADDAAKINVAEIFKLLSPTTEVKTI